jgi:hypothetical protein
MKIKYSSDFDKYNSSNLLFSIPIHERQDILNNQIENILNYNPNSNIILHVNKSFKNFNKLLTIYPNVYINSENLNYIYGKGLLYIHIKNFLEAIKLNINFKYFIIISSNELFIKSGLINYIEEYKNGCQIIKFNKEIKWHNFQKGLEDTLEMKLLLKELNLNSFYGGQTEGQFYEKNIFNNIANIYLKFYGSKEINTFETEEILSSTIFKSFNINYTLPFTLQNYTNNIIFNDTFINQLRNENLIIPNNFINETLLESPHVNQESKNIFSIKRVDRTFNNIRNYLSNKGFILNFIKNEYLLNTWYFSNGSSIYLFDDDHFKFIKKKQNEKKDFNWFGFNIDKGYYYLNFDIKINEKINLSEKIGLIINDHYIYNFFLYNLNEWNSISLPIDLEFNQIIKFSFNDYYDEINIEIKNVELKNIEQKLNLKENIIINLYEKNNNSTITDYSINYYNIYNKIIKPFEKIYNIYIFISLFTYKNIINYYKPYNIKIINNDKISLCEIYIQNIENILDFQNKNNINFKFALFFDIQSIFKENIMEFNFYVNKFNLLSYHIPYINNNICNSDEFLSIPIKYINNLYNLLIDEKLNKNICHLIYSLLKNIIGKNNFNFIFDNNYEINSRTPLIKYLSDIDYNIKNNGFLLNNYYLYDIIYKNKYSKFIKINNNEFYFHKIFYSKSTPFQWLGLEYLNINNSNFSSIKINIEFEINLLKNINYNDNINFGLKTHEPKLFYKDWIKKCIINEYTKINLEINISNKNQFIIFNFDDYLYEIDFYLKNFKIITSI